MNNSGLEYTEMCEKQLEFFKVILAERNIEIECNYRAILYQCRDYLSEFDYPDFVVRVMPEELITERIESVMISRQYPDVSFRYADEFVEIRLLYQKIAQFMLAYDTLLMHGSVVATGEEGYMFCAPSGVGKSTRTKIWIDQFPDSYVVNGDKPLIRITDDRVYAYGTPWCGKEGWNKNVRIPLRAIFLLERANKENDNFIEEIGIGKAFPFLISQTNPPKDAEEMKKTIALLKALDKKVKIYKYRSTPTSEAVRLAYETAKP